MGKNKVQQKNIDVPNRTKRSNRAKKRERASYHDSRRWLKYHPPRRSDPLFGLKPKETWRKAVDKVIADYPRLKHQQMMTLTSGGLWTSRRSISAEAVVMRAEDPVLRAVKKALAQFPQPDRERIQAILWGWQEQRKEDGATIGLFRRYLAVYLGYGRERYDQRSS